MQRPVAVTRRKLRALNNCARDQSDDEANVIPDCEFWLARDDSLVLI